MEDCEECGNLIRYVYMKKASYTAIFLKKGSWILGWVEEVPGVNIQEKTYREARSSLQEALMMTLEANAMMLKDEYKKSRTKPTRERLDIALA